MNKQNTRAMAIKTRGFRWLALVGHVGLIIWLSIWYLILGTRLDHNLSFILIVFILPLLLPLPGVIAAKPYTHAWACFIVLFYFLNAITEMYTEADYFWHASLELLLAVMMFVGCSMFARLRGAEMGNALPKLSVVMQEEKEYFENNKKHPSVDHD